MFVGTPILLFLSMLFGLEMVGLARKKVESNMKKYIEKLGYKILIIFIFPVLMMYCTWGLFIDDLIIRVKETPITYSGQMEEMVFAEQWTGGVEIYNITLRDSNDKDIVCNMVQVTVKPSKGEWVEIIYNPERIGVVAKINEKETLVYKYQYKSQGYVTVKNIIGTISLTIILQVLIYIKEYKKVKETKRSKVFRYLWLGGGVIFGGLAYLSLWNKIEYYSVRNVVKIFYCIFVFGEYFYIVDMKGIDIEVPFITNIFHRKKRVNGEMVEQKNIEKDYPICQFTPVSNRLSRQYCTYRYKKEMKEWIHETIVVSIGIIALIFTVAVALEGKEILVIEAGILLFPLFVGGYYWIGKKKCRKYEQAAKDYRTCELCEVTMALREKHKYIYSNGQEKIVRMERDMDGKIKDGQPAVIVYIPLADKFYTDKPETIEMIKEKY